MTRLELMRFEHGLTLTEVASATGLSRGTVSNAESGVHLTPRTAKALADLYEVSVAEILGVAGVAA